MGKYNEYQTQITEDMVSNKEIFDEIMEVMEGIPFVKNLTSKDRPRLKDLKRKDYHYPIKDKYGKLVKPLQFRTENKIEVDLTNPHILEDMDYFRPAAIHFQKHGRYTFYTRNKHPRSPYRKFWREEKRRCIEGYVRESDGEWIPGYYYFYLNYSPILQTQSVEMETIDDIENIDLTKNIRADRIKDFPKVWDGDYLYFHYVEQAEEQGMFGTALKTRGRGFSLKTGSMPVRNALLINNSRSFLMAHNKKYLLGDGLWSKSMDVLDYCAKHTPWPRLRETNQQSIAMTVKMGYKEKGSDDVKGINTLIQGIIFNHDPDNARGIRGKIIAYEEAGSFPKLLDAWRVSASSLKQSRSVFGFQIAFGTGGEDDEADFQSLESLFRSPTTYNVYNLPNIYDMNPDTRARVAFFAPEYLNRDGCYDKDGNSDVVRALIEVFEERYIIKHSPTDPFAIIGHKAEHPITPMESMMRKTGTYFPVSDLSDRLNDIKLNEAKFVAPHYTSELIISNGKIKWELSDKVPLRSYTVNKQDLAGCIEIFQKPAINSEGKTEPDRYILGIDPYDDDKGVSLGSVFVFDLFTDKIVAEYTGRPPLASDFYEICRRLAIYYNAKVNFENNKKGIWQYFKNKNSLQYMMLTPEILKEKQILKTVGHGNDSYGTPATKAVNQWALQLQADWLSTEVDVPINRDDRAETDENEVPLRNLDKLRSLGYIEECIKWNPEGNFDRVSAMGMVMIAREDRLNRIENSMKKRIKRKSEDPFLRSIFSSNTSPFAI